MEYALEINDLSVDFQTKAGKLKVLDGLDLKIGQGKVFGFLGPNGAGKTTTMHILLGFIQPTSGQAKIFGEDVQKSIARQRIGFLPEHPDTYKYLTGRELLKLSGQIFGIKGARLKERISDLLEQTDMKEASSRRIATYSRGMLQRICLAQALINNPDLVILDEPTGGLDPFGRQAIRDIISDLKKAGKTVFFSSHELSEVETVCDHLAIIARGKIAAQGAAKDLIKPGESLERFFMDTVRRASKDA